MCSCIRCLKPTLHKCSLFQPALLARREYFLRILTCWKQNQPCSMVHSSEQPSDEAVLLSSHCSGNIWIPFPQFLGGAGVVCTTTAIVVLCCCGFAQKGISLLVSSERPWHDLQSASSDLSASVEVPSGQRMHFSLSFKFTPVCENSSAHCPLPEHSGFA